MVRQFVCRPIFAPLGAKPLTQKFKGTMRLAFYFQGFGGRKQGRSEEMFSICENSENSLAGGVTIAATLSMSKWL